MSTSEDVALFIHALSADQIVSASTLAHMTTFVEPPDIDVPQQTGYGLGQRNLLIDGEGPTGHTGSIPGYSGIVMHKLTEGYTIAVLSNVSVIHQTEVLAELQNAVVGK